LAKIPELGFGHFAFGAVAPRTGQDQVLDVSAAPPRDRESVVHVWLAGLGGGQLAAAIDAFEGLAPQVGFYLIYGRD
jgi:hypothetical protein